MNLYLWSLLLGAVGLGAMALMGLDGSGHHGGSSHGHGGHGHGHGGHARGGSHSHGHTQGHAQGGHAHNFASRSFWTITSPRYLFSLALGFGTAGQLLQSTLGGPLLLAAAVAGAVVFERVIVSPLWNFAMRFASTPADSLESAVHGRSDGRRRRSTRTDRASCPSRWTGRSFRSSPRCSRDDRLLGGAGSRRTAACGSKK